MKMAKTVEEYLSWHPDYKDELKKLREILSKTELVETVKWGMPTYTVNNKNVVGLGAFKSYVGIWFFNGTFMSDPAGKLLNAQEGKTQGMRQWRFSTVDEIDPKLVLQYLEEAIKNQKEGKEIKPEKKPLVIPDELKEALASDAELSEIFDQLTLTNKRDFADYIQEAKREETKQKRLDKIIPMIRDGVGLNDKYK